MSINSLSVLNCWLILNVDITYFQVRDFFVTADAVIRDHTVRLSMFGMLIMLLNYSTVSSGVTRVLSQARKLS